jgi:hypothetical protein
LFHYEGRLKAADTPYFLITALLVLKERTPLVSSLLILHEWILLVQWNSGIDNHTVSQHHQAYITPGERLTDEVWTTFKGNMATARDLAREDVRALWKYRILISTRIGHHVHDGMILISIG